VTFSTASVKTGKSADAPFRNRYPNLRLRPHAPNRGRGRLQVQIRRAFAACGEVLSSSEVYDWTHARHRAHGQLVRQRERHGVWLILRQVAEPVGRAETIGRPWLWRLKGDK
jgi:hypothetical protein